MQVFSFDIFDTVITRRLARPVDVFTLLGERLREEGIRVPPRGLFRLLRIRCERWSRRFDPSQEVALPDIHRMMGRFLAWSAAEVVRAAELEREVEASVLTATTHGRKAVEDARRAGARIAYVSDMYLDGDFLRSILKREGLYADGDLLAVSVEWKASKTRGSIWQPLLERLGVSPQEVLHQGDNPQSDVDSARAAGIASRRLGTSEVSRWEEPPRRHTAEELSRHGGIAAMSRLARARCADPDDYWTSLGTGVIGPLLAGFSSWLLDQARRDGLGTLWFLSRDGWLLLESTRLMAAPDGPGLDYLCASRRQLLLLQPDSLWSGRLLDGSRCPSLRLVGARLFIPEDSLVGLALELGMAADSLDQVLEPAARTRLMEVLGTATWQDRLDDWKRRAGEGVRAYLDGKESQVSGKLGIVDVGWQGRSQDYLERVLPGTGPLRGYYVGYAGSVGDPGQKAGWLYDHAAGRGFSPLHAHQRMFEVMIGGVSGPLTGYQRSDSGWQPVFEAGEKGELAPGRDRMHSAALEFVRVAADPSFAGWWTEETLRQVACRNLERLLLHPTEQDAREFGAWSASTDDAHLDGVPLAQGFDLPRISACLGGRQPWAMLWPKASLQNSTGCGRAIMGMADILRNFLSRRNHPA